MQKALVFTLALAASLRLAAAGPRTFAVDPEQSRATIVVGKAGLFSFAGHTHEVEAPLANGIVHLDPGTPSQSDVHLEFNAAALRVTGKDEPPGDVPKVTETMLGEQVLDVRNYPAITFQSTRVTATGAAPALTLTVTGDLTIHGTTKTVTVPVAVRLDGAAMTATGRFSIKQSGFGIRPISIGGVVKVKDELNITFTIAARER